MASILPHNGQFRAFVRRKGITETKMFGTRYEAAVWAARREQEILTGTSPQQIARELTLHGLLIRFRDEDVPRRAGCRWETIRINSFLKTIKDVPLTKLKPTHFAEWKNKRLGEVKGASVRRDMTLMQAALETARRDWNWLTSNPMADVRKPPPSPSRKRLIVQSEIDLILWALNYAEDGPILSVGQTVAVAFLIALETGMRAGELMKAKVEGKVARLLDQEVVGDATKNGDEREVPLSRRARELYAKVGNKIELRPGVLDSMFRKARGKAGLSGFTFHDSRHYACTQLAKKLQPMDLAKMLGHRSLKQTLEYYNPRTEDLADLLD